MINAANEAGKLESFWYLHPVYFLKKIRKIKRIVNNFHT